MAQHAGWVACSLKFIVSGEKLIKHTARAAPRFSNEDDERIFRSLARSDFDDGRDNVDSDWRQRGG